MAALRTGGETSFHRKPCSSLRVPKRFQINKTTQRAVTKIIMLERPIQRRGRRGTC